MKTCLILFLLPTLAASFSVKPRRTGGFATFLYSHYNPVDDKIYQDYADKWLNQQQQLRQQQQQQQQQQPDHQDEPKVPTFEADYLAAAKMRAANRPQSNNSQSRLEDWQTMSEEKRKQYGIRNDNWDEAIRKEEEEWNDDVGI